MPTPMERAPDPGLDYVPIPKLRYTSPEFAALEWEKMWTKVWLMAGRESDIPNPGDYFTFEIGRESILVVRQRDGSIGARYNVCMHRGNRLREPGRGHAEKFSCIFHGWEYDIDGCLRQALDPESFPQGLPKERLDLRPLQCDTWAGFVFVNMDPEAISLAPRPLPLRELEAQLRLYGRGRVQLEDLRGRLQRGLPPLRYPRLDDRLQ